LTKKVVQCIIESAFIIQQELNPQAKEALLSNAQTVRTSKNINKTPFIRDEMSKIFIKK